MPTLQLLTLVSRSRGKLIPLPFPQPAVLMHNVCSPGICFLLHVLPMSSSVCQVGGGGAERYDVLVLYHSLVCFESPGTCALIILVFAPLLTNRLVESGQLPRHKLDVARGKRFILHQWNTPLAGLTNGPLYVAHTFVSMVAQSPRS